MNEIFKHLTALQRWGIKEIAVKPQAYVEYARKWANDVIQDARNNELVWGEPHSIALRIMRATDAEIIRYRLANECTFRGVYVRPAA